MWPEINDRKGEDVGIIVPDKRCVIYLIASMKKIIDNNLIEENKSGKTHEHVNRSFHIFDYSKIMKMVRVLGLMVVISYMTVILFIWIYANFMGYVYFSAGEPLLMIKYIEWVLGFIGIFVVVDYLRRELDGN